MAENEVNVKVTTETEIKDVEDLEDKLQELRDQKIQVQLESDTQELETVNSQITETQDKISDLKAKVEVDNSEIETLESELAELEAQRLELNVDVDSNELEEIDSQIGDVQNSLSSLQASVEVDNSEIESLEDELSDLEARQLQLTINTEYTDLEEVEARIEELEEKRVDIYMGVDDSELQDVESELDALETRQIELTLNVDSTGLDEVNSKLDETESKSQSTASSIDSLGSALTGVAAAAGLEQMVNTAGNISDSWNRLDLTFGGVSESMKQSINSVSEATGRSGGTIRDYFNQMGIAGVTNTDLLSQSFESLAGRAYQTGNSIEAMENVMQRMVLSGNAGARQLTQLGISTEDLGRAMGVSAEEASKAFSALSQEDRLRVLTQAMGDGKQANEDYKNSWQGVKDQASAAFAGLMGAVGTPILQMLIPAMKTATSIVKSFTNAFKGLPGPLQQIIGGFGGVVLGATAIAGTLGVAGKVVKGLYDGFKTLQKAVKFIRELEIATKAYAAAETIANGVRKAAAAAQAFLNLVMSMNPIALVVIAIVALIAILWYLYNTCEPVRNAIDAIWAGVSGAIQPIIDSVQWLIDKLTQLANGDWTVTIEIAKAGASAGIEGIFDVANNDLSRGLFEAIAGEEALAQADEGMPILKEKLTSGINEMLDSIWNDGTQGFLGWLANIAGIDVGSYLTGLQTSFNQIPQWVNQAGTGAIQGFQNMFNGVSNWLNSTIGNVISFGSRLVSNMGNSARNAVSQFTSGISRLGNALRDELNGMLSDAANFVGEIGRIMWNAAVNAWNNFLNGLQRHSPGIMMREFKAEMLGIVSTAEDTKDPLGDSMYRLANTAVKSWGNPTLSYPTLENGNLGGNASGANGDIARLLSNILEVLRNQTPTSNVTYNHYGDIDDEQKMQEILEYIRKYLYFNNATAGRTV